VHAFMQVRFQGIAGSSLLRSLKLAAALIASPSAVLVCASGTALVGRTCVVVPRFLHLTDKLAITNTPDALSFLSSSFRGTHTHAHTHTLASRVCALGLCLVQLADTMGMTSASYTPVAAAYTTNRSVHKAMEHGPLLGITREQPAVPCFSEVNRSICEKHENIPRRTWSCAPQ
jgi:hypothetical protein